MMRSLLAVTMIVLSAASARADFFYKLVGYQCDKKAKAVILTYTGALNEAGRKLMKNKGPTQWDPWKLIVKSKDGNLIQSYKDIRKQCELEDGTYDVTIGPLPGNANLQGMCGAFITAWAEVRRGAELVLPRHSFEYGDCHSPQPVTTKIVIRAGNKELVVQKIPWEEFYKAEADEEE